ncbi:LytR/AlgR family response regulator transcription factor [Larkinella soli]|uniref:LytR/AlgR family response regulator transcription factor n=1 Tax=Larkinella soli TaxID=1770527 RepID=UPI000FFC6EB7|nr:LytTR family DNA-binding domain-containing protein [Larkinella soli]
MNILIIEDEELTARKLRRLVQEVEPTAQVVGITGSVEESVEWLRTQPGPDLILMDIELADGQSFDIFNRIRVTSPVIFTTAYDEFAIKAFKVNSIDYLLKPVKEEDLRSALSKLQAMRQALGGPATGGPAPNLEASLAGLLRQLQAVVPAAAPPSPETPFPPAPYRDRFLIRQGQRLFSVGIDEVAYFFSRNKMSFLKTRDEHDWMVDYTMDELAAMLDPRRFFRLNRQIIAELRSVDKVHLYFNGKLKISLRPAAEEEVIVSREKSAEFRQWLGE